MQYRCFVAASQTQRVAPVATKGHYKSEDDLNVLILHSSGTTGVPKTIRQSHHYLLTFAPYGSFQFDAAWRLQDEQRMGFSTLPLCHVYGLLNPMQSLSIGKPFAIPPTDWKPSAQLTVDLVNAVEAHALFTVPSMLSDMAKLPDNYGINTLRRLDYVINGGGSLSDAIGDKLVASGVKVVHGFGSTEAGSLGVLKPRAFDDDWRFFHLRKDRNCSVRKIALSSHSNGARYQIIVRPPGWSEDHVLSDTFAANLEIDGWFLQPTACEDEAIVLATGATVQPRLLELTLSNQPGVKDVVAVGRGYYGIGLLIEPDQNMTRDQRESLKVTLWPSIIDAGRKLNAHARIRSIDAVVMLRPGQSFPRSAKGTVLRRLVYEDFQKEMEVISAVYGTHRDSNVPKLEGTRDVLEGEILEYIVSNALTSHVHRPNKTDNLFEMGMSSMQANQLLHFLAADSSVHGALSSIPKDLIYACPTISSICDYFYGHDVDSMRHHEAHIWTLLQKHASSPVRKCDSQVTVLLTGGNGSLGCHLLAQLAIESKITRVICLNRFHLMKNTKLEIRQYACSSRKGARMPDESRSKIKIIEADIRRPFFGLPASVYQSLASSVTHIVHNAWPVDFQRNVSSFVDQFTIMTNLINLALNCWYTPRFLFISSIAVVSEYGASTPPKDQPVLAPEQPFNLGWTIPKIGSAQAQLVCEKMLERAVKDHALDGSIVRCAQISGARSNGYWNASELIPTMVRYSQKVGALPHLEGTISWLPLEDATATILDLLMTSSCHQLIYHVENPARRTWLSVMQVLSETLILPTISKREWLCRLQPKGDEEALLEFFQFVFDRIGCGVLCLDTKTTQTISQTLRSLEMVQDDLVKMYCQ